MLFAQRQGLSQPKFPFPYNQFQTRADQLACNGQIPQLLPKEKHHLPGPCIAPFIKCFLSRHYLSCTQKADTVFQMKRNKRHTLKETRERHSNTNQTQEIIQKQLLKALDSNAVKDTVREKERLKELQFPQWEICSILKLHPGELRKRRKDSNEQGNTWRVLGHWGYPSLWFLVGR